MGTNGWRSASPFHHRSSSLTLQGAIRAPPPGPASQRAAPGQRRAPPRRQRSSIRAVSPSSAMAVPVACPTERATTVNRDLHAPGQNRARAVKEQVRRHTPPKAPSLPKPRSHAWMSGPVRRRGSSAPDRQIQPATPCAQVGVVRAPFPSAACSFAERGTPTRPSTSRADETRRSALPARARWVRCPPLPEQATTNPKRRCRSTQVSRSSGTKMSSHVSRRLDRPCSWW